jgi:nucleoside phosphorylase
MSSYGPGHPTKPTHDDNFWANWQQQQQQSSGSEQQHLAVDMVGSDEGDTISFGGVEFSVPSGTYLCVLDDAESDASPKAFGR